MANSVMSEITLAAKMRIEEICRSYKTKTGEDPIPAIVWLEAKQNPAALREGVAIALYDRIHEKELEGDIVHISGVECVLAIPEQYNVKFKSKKLDFVEGRFELF